MMVSSSVGTSGMVALRALVSTASGRTDFVASCGKALLKSSAMIDTCPPMSAVSASGLLR